MTNEEQQYTSIMLIVLTFFAFAIYIVSKQDSIDQTSLQNDYDKLQLKYDVQVEINKYYRWKLENQQYGETND